MGCEYLETHSACNISCRLNPPACWVYLYFEVWIFAGFLFTSGCWTYYMTLIYDAIHEDFDPTHDLDLELCVFFTKRWYAELFLSQTGLIISYKVQLVMKNCPTLIKVYLKEISHDLSTNYYKLYQLDICAHNQHSNGAIEKEVIVYCNSVVIIGKKT